MAQLHASQERVDNFVELENMDRNAYYDLLMMEHESEVNAQVEAKKPEIREQRWPKVATNPRLVFCAKR
ncbi:MAG TPA: hypothetical protein EYN66_21200 [Myxococcales bacterium]|nr:hypothetical protein [Myxococcales bacterium]